VLRLTDWVVENLENALGGWNNKLAEIWSLLTESPETFRGGSIWEIINRINEGLQAIGLGLLVLFFVMGLVKTCSSYTEVRKPEHVLKVFVRFALAKGAVVYGMELMLAIFEICQGILSTVMTSAGLGGNSGYVLPEELISAINECSFWQAIPLWAVTLIGSLLITVLSLVMILTVYGRFFKLYMYVAIAPIPLSTFAGEPSQRVGISFLKSFAAVCLEGAVIILACMIFSAFATTAPEVNVDASAVTMVWSYIGELAFQMLVLVGTVKMADRVVREMMGV
jgi:hypothetical protein